MKIQVIQYTSKAGGFATESEMLFRVVLLGDNGEERKLSEGYITSSDTAMRIALEWKAFISAPIVQYKEVVTTTVIMEKQ